MVSEQEGVLEVPVEREPYVSPRDRENPPQTIQRPPELIAAQTELHRVADLRMHRRSELKKNGRKYVTDLHKREVEETSIGNRRMASMDMMIDEILEQELPLAELRDTIERITGIKRLGKPLHAKFDPYAVMQKETSNDPE